MNPFPEMLTEKAPKLKAAVSPGRLSNSVLVHDLHYYDGFREAFARRTAHWQMERVRWGPP